MLPFSKDLSLYQGFEIYVSGLVYLCIRFLAVITVAKNKEPIIVLTQLKLKESTFVIPIDCAVKAKPHIIEAKNSAVSDLKELFFMIGIRTLQ